jgi:hypothetical protein
MGYVELMAEIKMRYLEGKTPLIRSRHTCEYNIKNDYREMKSHSGRVLLKTVIKFPVHTKLETS